jgi:hypothetical protein
MRTVGDIQEKMTQVILPKAKYFAAKLRQDGYAKQQ